MLADKEADGHSRGFSFDFWLCHMTCGILFPWPGLESMPPAVEAQSLNHWTARGVLRDFLWAEKSPFITLNIKGESVGLQEASLFWGTLVVGVGSHSGSRDRSDFPWTSCLSTVVQDQFSLPRCQLATYNIYKTCKLAFTFYFSPLFKGSL